MVLIYRGLGIIVPIVFFITGLIVSVWIKDARVGNPDFIGWEKCIKKFSRSS